MAESRTDGQLILVSAMTFTPQGEGKTTATIGLADALRRLGKRSMVCLREPSLVPYFGIKGGATGGGRARRICRLADLRVSGNSGWALGQTNRMIVPTRNTEAATRYPAGTL